MVQIPSDKRFFRIGEASRILGVEPYVLRYWESEFPQIRPRRADSKQRTYQKKDLETLFEIKKLLYDEKMTIEGAKQLLKRERAEGPKPDHHFFNTLKSELREILEMLR
jgi:DNA-binding transcriptional MerR regulator